MSEQNTQGKDPQKEDTQTKDSAKEQDVVEAKRYNDLQAEYTRNQQRLKELEETNQNLQGNYEQLTTYLQQQQAPQQEDTSAYDYVSKKDLEAQNRQLAQQIEASNLASEFRSKHPDMVQYEDMVSYYLQNKTDKRKSLRDRMEAAVASVKDYNDAERKRGIENARQEQEQTQAKEAEASGISYETTPTESAPSAETGNEYITWRRKRKAAKMGM